MSQKRVRRVYTPEFKREAVRRMQERRQAKISLAQISRELEVRADILRQWERALGVAPAVSRGELGSAEEELRRLRRELETVRMERDFLEKAAVDSRGQRNSACFSSPANTHHGEDRSSRPSIRSATTGLGALEGGEVDLRDRAGRRGAARAGRRGPRRQPRPLRRAAGASDARAAGDARGPASRGQADAGGGRPSAIAPSARDNDAQRPRGAHRPQSLGPRGFAVGGGTDRVWVADATFLPTGEGWRFLALVLDLATRRAVGWATGSTLDTARCATALARAVAARQPAPGLLHHSDRGSTYASGAYQAQLHALGAVASMSRTGDCWDNAVAESFFATLEWELLDGVRFRTHAAATNALPEFIDRWYNLDRFHSSLGYRSPMPYERFLQDQAAMA